MPRTLLPLYVMTLALMLAACSSQPSHPPASYKVRSGETLYSIANAYRTSVAALKRDNRNVRVIRPGMILNIPIVR